MWLVGWLADWLLRDSLVQPEWGGGRVGRGGEDEDWEREVATAGITVGVVVCGGFWWWR